MANASAPATPTPTVATPPAIAQGRRGKTLPDEYVNAVVGVLNGLNNGDVATTGETYADKNKARKAVELLRRELIRVGFVDDKAKISTRVWQDGDVWVAGVARKAE